MAADLSQAVDVVLVGAGERGRAWLELLRRSSRLKAVAVVARSRPASIDLPHLPSIAAALDAHPTASFAVALPPIRGLDAALELAAAERTAVVEAPLDLRLANVSLPPRAGLVRVAHGWATLAGASVVANVLAELTEPRLRLAIAGLPEQEHGDTLEVLVHALALARRLIPDVEVISTIDMGGGALELELRATNRHGSVSAMLRVSCHGQRVEAQIESGDVRMDWSVRDGRESMRRDGRMLVEARPVLAGEVRALAQLLPGASRGDDLIAAREVMALTEQALGHLPTALPLGQRAFLQSAAIAARAPDDSLRPLGLRGEIPDAGAVDVIQPPTLREPFELWAFRAGLKPVTFLTVREDEVEATRALFGDVHCEERRRRVRVESQDRWVDRRDEGEERVELYLAKDPVLARRAAEIQSEGDPTCSLGELGALVGYPRCCVEAFARQDDRSNNTRNRYFTYARSCRPDGTPLGPFPCELNNLHTVLVPFYPCSYRCERAMAWARASFAELAAVHPKEAEELRRLLSLPVLYFDHDHQIIFDGAMRGEALRYSGVAVPSWARARAKRLGSALAQAQLLEVRPEALETAGSERRWTLRRSDPNLGFLAPFGG